MKKLSTKDFVSKANIAHENRYKYERCNYINSRTKVCITCPEHGDFMQNAASHLSGHGCPVCKSESASITYDDFVERASYIHAGLYKYHKDSYINASKKTRITCKKHGDFYKVGMSHLLGKGCPSCALEKRRTSNDDFIAKCKSIHGERYKYDKCMFKISTKKVCITCEDHGDFYQFPSNHLAGNGCPECRKYGFKMSKKSHLYLLCDMNGNVKVGVSSRLKQRLVNLRCETPFKFYLLSSYIGSGYDVYDTEQFLLRKYQSSGFSGFDGSSEWLVYNDEMLKDISDRGLIRG